MRFALLICIVVLSSCAPARQQVAPANEIVKTESGHRAAVVPILPDRARWGRAVVWSRGAYQREAAHDRRNVVHTAIEIENTSGRELRVALSEAKITINPHEDRAIENIRASTQEEAVVAPGSQKEYHLYFPLPSELVPRGVDAFEVTLPIFSGGESALVRAYFAEREPPVVRGGAGWWYEPYPLGWWRYSHPFPFRHPYYW